MPSSPQWSDNVQLGRLLTDTQAAWAASAETTSVHQMSRRSFRNLLVQQEERDMDQVLFLSALSGRISSMEGIGNNCKCRAMCSWMCSVSDVHPKDIGL